MNVLLISPEVRLDNAPYFWPFWAGSLASIVEAKKGDVAILDLNALRSKYCVYLLLLHYTDHVSLFMQPDLFYRHNV